MSNNITLPAKIVDETGSPTLAFRQYMEQIVNNPYSRAGNVGTLLSGKAQADARIEAVETNTATAATVAAAGGGLLASASPASVNKSGTGVTTTAAVTVTPAGGTGPYTYAWTLKSGATLTLSAPTSATTTFSGNLAGSTPELLATYTCTVTDTFDSSTAAVDVSVFLSNIGGIGAA